RELFLGEGGPAQGRAKRPHRKRVRQRDPGPSASSGDRGAEAAGEWAGRRRVRPPDPEFRTQQGVSARPKVGRKEAGEEGPVSLKRFSPHWKPTNRWPIHDGHPVAVASRLPCPRAIGCGPRATTNCDGRRPGG